MADPVKRLHYFNGQFLRAQDFTTEQDYHLQIRRLHNRLLHTTGIADGLKVEIQPGGAAITVRPGVAYDGQGREIILLEEHDEPLPNSSADLFVTIAYGESQTDPTDETGSTGETRWSETPQIAVSSSAPADPTLTLVLGRIFQDGEQKKVDERGRRLAGVVGGDLQVRSLLLSSDQFTESQWPRLNIGAANLAILTGSLRVTTNVEVQSALAVTGNATVGGNLTVTGALTGKLAANLVNTPQLVDNAVTAAKIADGNVGVNELANNAVTEPKVADGAVSIRKLSTQLVASTNVTVPVGSTVQVPIATPIAATDRPPITHLLVRAFSTTARAVFSWSQGSITLADGRHQQILIFRNNEQGSAVAIVVQYEIFMLREG